MIVPLALGAGALYLLTRRQSGSTNQNAPVSLENKIDVNSATQQGADAMNVNSIGNAIQNAFNSLLNVRPVSSSARVATPVVTARAPAGATRPPSTITLSQRGLNQIASHEAWRSKAYKDTAGKWTIGYGHLIIPGDGFSSASVITHEVGMSLLRADARIAERCVQQRVTRPLNQNQFDALVSFVFNVGCGAFGGSTLLRLVNAGQFPTAANEFAKWVNSGGRYTQGLANRRVAERALFLA